MAFLLEGLAFNITANPIFRAIDLKLENVLDSLMVSASKFNNLQQELIKSIDTFTNTRMHMMESNNNARQSLVEVMEDLQLHVEKLAKVPALTRSAIPNTSAHPDTVLSSNPPLTYAVAAQKPPPLMHAMTVARYDERLCQIAIQPDLESPESQGLHMLSD